MHAATTAVPAATALDGIDDDVMSVRHDSKAERSCCREILLKSTVRRAHLLRLDLLPAFIRVKRRDALGALLGVFAEVPLMDHSCVADDKGHLAGVALVGRIGNERKAPDHLALDQIVERAAGRVRSLLSENTIVIAVIGPRTTAGLVTFCGRLGRELA